MGCYASGSFWPQQCVPPEQVSHCRAGCQLARKPGPSFPALGLRNVFLSQATGKLCSTWCFEVSGAGGHLEPNPTFDSQALARSLNSRCSPFCSWIQSQRQDSGGVIWGKRYGLGTENRQLLWAPGAAGTKASAPPPDRATGRRQHRGQRIGAAARGWEALGCGGRHGRRGRSPGTAVFPRPSLLSLLHPEGPLPHPDAGAVAKTACRQGADAAE